MQSTATWVMMKPAIGMTPKESAEVHQVALGRADGEMDDELLATRRARPPAPGGSAR